jgi:hypothetical protein
LTQDEIIEMANKVGINPDADTLCRHEGWIEPFKAFAKLVAAHTLSSIDPSKLMSYQEGIEVGRARPWVGLTDEERKEIMRYEKDFWGVSGWEWKCMEALEAKLKEKNFD